MGAFKLGKMTFGSLFKKPETVLYPIEEKPKPMGLKGHIVIDVNRCIVCGMCDRSCSTDCIKVDRKARTWEINPFGCVQCGYCVTVCPKDCLAMDPHYFPVGTGKTSECYEIPEQPKQEKASKPEPKAATGTPSEERAVKAAQEEPLDAGIAEENDEQLQTLIDLMEEEKAAKVKAALGR